MEEGEGRGAELRLGEDGRGLGARGGAMSLCGLLEGGERAEGGEGGRERRARERERETG